MRLENKIAIITGAARGIGRSAAEIFAREGATVIIWDMLDEGEQTAQAIRDSGAQAEFMKISVTDVPGIEEAVRTIVEKYGRIDILVNNAGITRDRTLLKMSHAEWQQVMDVNLTGVFNCTKAVVPYMVEKGFGRIICTSSVVEFTEILARRTTRRPKQALLPCAGHGPKNSGLKASHPTR